MKRVFAFLIFIFGCCLVLPHAGEGEGAPDEEKGSVAKIASDGVQRVEIVGGSYFFKPDHIVVKVDVPVRKTRK